MRTDIPLSVEQMLLSELLVKLDIVIPPNFPIPRNTI